jgi:DNA polymerase-3 subunit gamma/tau
MRVLTRMWQMLLKALEEVSAAPNAMMAAEMAIIRLTHVADLPSPEELIRKIQDTPAPSQGTGGNLAHGARSPTAGGGGASAVATTPQTRGTGSAQTAPAILPDTALARFPSFEHVIELIRANRDVKLLVEVETCVRLVSYRPGRIEFVPTDAAPNDLAQRLGARLQTWTGQRWGISVVTEGGAPTIMETRDAVDIALKTKAAEHPMVKAVLSRFPKARITQVRTPDQIAADVSVDALPEVEDEWDPFEDS